MQLFFMLLIMLSSSSAQWGKGGSENRRYLARKQENEEILRAITQELGENPENEKLRMGRFQQLRKLRDEANQLEKIKRDKEIFSEMENDIWKNGTVVKYLAYFSFGLLMIFLCFIAKDANFEASKQSGITKTKLE